MARNRKYRTAAVRFGPALKAFLLCLLIGGSGVGYVWQKNQIYQLGQQITNRERRLSELQDQNKRLRKQWGMMRSPTYLEEKIKKLNLGLITPPESNIWRLVEPARELPAQEREREYAAQEGRAMP